MMFSVSSTFLSRLEQKTPAEQLAAITGWLSGISRYRIELLHKEKSGEKVMPIYLTTLASIEQIANALREGTSSEAKFGVQWIETIGNEFEAVNTFMIRFF